MGALSGIRVLDLGVLVQAPQAALLLGDMGATVIKVELPGMGDQSRWIPATYGHSESGYWIGCNRGKQSVTIDLRKPEGRDVFLRLADTADVVVSNFKPGTLDEWGLGYEVLAARNPRVIYATGATFGAIGLNAHREGADLAGQAAGGLISTTGVDGGPVTPMGATIADHMSSQHLASGILAALFARVTTGRGQRVDVSLVGGAIWAQASEFSAYLASGKIPGRSNGGHPLINGTYGILATANGHIAVVGVVAAARPAFAKLMGNEALFDDPRFAAPLMSEENKIALLGVLGPMFATKTTDEWMTELRAIGARCAPVRDYAAIVADPDVYENGYLVKVQDPNRGEYTVVGSPLRMSDTPMVPSVRAPELGEHTEEVLLELGLDWDEIAALRDVGAI
jgi:crotonobetainyl-CoA:carnitine CoA-transferase CaiB-like acyl-CoA transferase